MTVADLPGVTASLNGLATILLLGGYASIRAGRVTWHRACMGAAFMASVAFLVSYLVYHAHVGSRHFEGTGTIRTFYFAVLLSHTLLAAVVPFAVIATIRLALRGSVESHRRLARWTLPAWLYVSVTGVLIYVMLYRLPTGH